MPRSGEADVIASESEAIQRRRAFLDTLSLLAMTHD
jgi:hypothetical protein